MKIQGTIYSLSVKLAIIPMSKIASKSQRLNMNIIRKDLPLSCLTNVRILYIESSVIRSLQHHTV